MPTELKVKALESNVKMLLLNLGINTTDPGFIETPARVARFFLEFTQREPPEIKTFPSCSTNLVQLNDYRTTGLCPHHLLPVHYKVSIRYIPNGLVYGISKLPRIVDYLLRTLPLQEDLPKLVVDYLFETLEVSYASCQVEGEHLCMTMRGVKAKDCTLTTFYEYTAPAGAFKCQQTGGENEVPSS